MKKFNFSFVLSEIISNLADFKLIILIGNVIQILKMVLYCGKY